MRSKIQLLAALTGACLSTGCVPYAYPPAPPYYDAPVAVEPLPPDEIIVPDVVIIENGVRHDRFFYLHHPEFYRRDRLRYPERFGPRPGYYRGPARPEYRGPARPDYRGAAAVRPDQRPGGPNQARPDDPKAKKKHPDDHDQPDH
jgi:hypothetical protein